MSEKIKKDRDWSEYPIGTKAWAIMGGHWEKVAGPPSGWKWCTGDTFPTPGGDTTGYVTLPDPYDQEVRRIAEILNQKMHGDKLHRPFLEEAARAIVAEMAKEVTAAYTPMVGMLTTQAYLIKRGLIPTVSKPETIQSPTKPGE